jgi:ribonuclease P protein subunit RPR2
MGRRHLGKRDAKDIARERIDRLFALAEQAVREGDGARSKRYVSLALRIGERHKVRSGHKRTYCRACHSFFIPPTNVRIRTGRGRISTTCLACGHVSRYPLEQKGKGR